METLLVGAGSMGRWAGGVLAEMGATLAVFDTDPAAAREAATALDGRVADPGPDDRFETVCVAVPIPAAPGAIATHGPRATEFVFDVAGTMSGPVEALAGLGTAERASVHPLFAPENEPGNVPLVVDADGPHLQRFRDTLEARGNHVFETTPDEHDRAMDTVQARTHAAVLAYGLAAEPVPDRFHTPLSASLSELVADVTDGDPRVYADIQTAFDGAKTVAAAADRLAAADPDQFARLYSDAAPDDRNSLQGSKYE